MANEWTIDPQHSGISFMVRHLLVAKVRGRFTKWTAAVRFDEKSPQTSSVEVDIDTSSVDTSEPQRDAHLRSPDFLDVERFPRMTYKSTTVERVSDTHFRAHGNLTIRDVTRPITLDVEYNGTMRDPWGQDRAGFAAKTTVDRKEFGIYLQPSFWITADLRSEKNIAIEIDVEATRAQAKAAG